MKLFWTLALFAASLPAALNPQLKQVSTVYILAMSSGMDQYLANRLTIMGVFQVVTDPQKADAIITDRLGEPFEAKMKLLYPPPAPPAPPPKDDKDKAAGKDDKKDEKDEANGAARMGSFSRSRGTIFIVDRKSRNVLWSIYERPKDSTPGEVSKSADRVVKHLKDDLTDKKQSGE